MSDVLLSNAILVGIFMLLVWLISIPCRNVSIVDIAWGLGFVLIAWLTFVLTANDPMNRPDNPARWLLLGLITVWGLRLSVHLAVRNIGQVEDKRYARMRGAAGPHFWWTSLFIVFALQGLVMWVVSLPIQTGIARSESGWAAGHIAGLALWTVGFLFEAIGDRQLARFKRRPENKGRVMDQGLWRYTRHPNYFGDFCVWWGMFVVCVAQGQHWWTVISPLLMSVLLLRVSGVTLLEKSLTAEKPAYADYVARTSAFFPLPPHRPSAPDETHA